VRTRTRRAEQAITHFDTPGSNPIAPPGEERAVRRYLPAIAMVSLLAVTLTVFQLVGLSGRRYAEGHKRHEVDSAQEGYTLLQGADVRGRVLVLFDTTSHVQMSGSDVFIQAAAGRVASASVLPDNFMQGLLIAGTVRELHVVVPDSQWEVVRATLTGRGDAIVTSTSARARLYGASVVYSTAANLPRFSEKVVVYVSQDVASQYPPALLSSFDDPGASDLYIVQK
jgi:hypothetical protein